MSTDEELQRDITRLALRALDGTPFALAGSGAIREHGIIDRPTQDIDLFTTDEGQVVEMDLGVDDRGGEPVTRSVGPVLGLDDAVANKVSALYSRAEARDYLDVDAIRTSGKFTDADLVAAAARSGAATPTGSDDRVRRRRRGA
ncbi:hypothetical protein [Plantibacter sp. VKM Ac-2876]|uniref:hypothetical protein n=1 Tax=Plantibacter sp. VKM Ac-2876 TaxID=2783826 RepID=UPI00188B54F0|nr:hypothetical protein [Plantibacter sp. VKM Ac-2876]MBF4564614.1 hypothetical protein [Plantibacter sp. VKM Ac-2876]